jgi:hypothetical protein
LPGAAGALAAGDAPDLAKPLSGIYRGMMQAQPRQRSLAEMANEQLNGGRAARDKLADGMAGAGLPDCVAPNAGASLLGLVTLPFAAATGKCKPPQ